MSMSEPAQTTRPIGPHGLPATVTFLAGFGLIWGVLYAAGTLQEGDGRWWWAALPATLAAAVAWEVGALRTPLRRVLADLGLGRPDRRGLVSAGVVSVLLAAFYGVYSLRVAPLPLRPGWPWLLLGLVSYHGVAEEITWRGYAFRRLREGRSFRAAVLWSMPLIALTHVPVIVSSGPVVGAAAIAVAAVTCLPLAHLWERGGRTIWAPALVHAAIDLFKLVEPPAGPATMTFSLSLALVSIVVPLLALASRGPAPAGQPGRAAAR